MSLAIVYSRASLGVQAPIITIETHISNGFPGLSIVGLPETVVKESKDRVRSAIINSHFEFPSRRITINLAPADLPKEGSRFDLPIALGILAASGQIPTYELNQYEFAGELALTGELRPIYGALPFAIATKNANRSLFLPIANAEEASLPSHITLYPAAHLLQVCTHLQKKQSIPCYIRSQNLSANNQAALDLAEVRGQTQAKRALEIAAAGQHSLLMIGSPGIGKTMLASRLPSILPAMTEEEGLQLAAIYSISNKPFVSELWRKRPFRAPHHTSSNIALVGGGRPPRPGEISLAHQGILFLDELPEFQRNALEALREPLESGQITISRAAYQSQFPAKFQLIAAMNPCPCGYLHDVDGRCSCTQEQIKKYQTKISGPLLDRIDIHIEVPRLPKHIWTTSNEADVITSAQVQARVQTARTIQLQRCGKTNAMLTNQELEQYCPLNAQARALLNNVSENLNLSARSYHRILKLARTIADLNNSPAIIMEYLSEAISLRCLDKHIMLNPGKNKRVFS